MGSLEFGKRGIEGLEGEGTDETRGWGELKNVPFAGENSMTRHANDINEILNSIKIEEPEEDVQPETIAESESKQRTEPQTYEEIMENAERTANETKELTKDMMSKLNSIFGDSEGNSH